jgi:hypothetical protein
MPVDAEGNRADIITDGDSTIKRMNVGRMYEQYINAASRTVTNQVRALFGAPIEAQLTADRYGWLTPEEQAPMASAKTNLAKTIQDVRKGLLREKTKQAWEMLLNYYAIVSPWMHEEVSKGSSTNPAQHVSAILEDGVYLHFPSDNPVFYPEMVSQIRASVPIPHGPVTYIGDSGNRVTTRANVLIGSIYFVLLEKTGDDHSGVASAKTQHFGIPACLTKYDKHSSASRSNPVRIAGESEVRLFAATIGGEKTAQLLDLSNSPASHKAVSRTILRSSTPTNVPVIVDREEVPMGNNRALAYANHMLECAGIYFYVPEQPQIAPEIYRDEVASPDEGEDELEVGVEVETDDEATAGKIDPAKLEADELEEDEDDDADTDDAGADED